MQNNVICAKKHTTNKQKDTINKARSCLRKRSFELMLINKKQLKEKLSKLSKLLRM
jgi:hypothetical protein